MFYIVSNFEKWFISLHADIWLWWGLDQNVIFKWTSDLHWKLNIVNACLIALDYVTFTEYLISIESDEIKFGILLKFIFIFAINNKMVDFIFFCYKTNKNWKNMCTNVFRLFAFLCPTWFLLSLLSFLCFTGLSHNQPAFIIIIIIIIIIIETSVWHQSTRKKSPFQNSVALLNSLTLLTT